LWKLWIEFRSGSSSCPHLHYNQGEKMIGTLTEIMGKTPFALIEALVDQPDWFTTRDIAEEVDMLYKIALGHLIQLSNQEILSYNGPCYRLNIANPYAKALIRLANSFSSIGAGEVDPYESK